MRLGEIITELSIVDLDLPVLIEGVQTFVPADVGSYRGYYEDLAIGWHYERPLKEKLVRDFLVVLKAADGQTFTGYKGGDYVMHAGTHVWISQYGQASGLQVRAVYVDDEKVYLGVKHRWYR